MFLTFYILLIAMISCKDFKSKAIFVVTFVFGDEKTVCFCVGWGATALVGVFSFHNHSECTELIQCFPMVVPVKAIMTHVLNVARDSFKSPFSLLFLLYLVTT